MTRAARTAAHGELAGRVALAGPGVAAEVAPILAARGLLAEIADGDPGVLVTAIARGASAVAWAAAEAVDAHAALGLTTACHAAAEIGRPLVALVPPVRGGAPSAKLAVERATALAHLRANGALVVADPDVWLEAIVLVAAVGVPRGARVAVVAPPGSWLERAASALAFEAEEAGRRGPRVGADEDEPVDAVLVDRAAGHADDALAGHRTPTMAGAGGSSAAAPGGAGGGALRGIARTAEIDRAGRASRALVVSVAARGELLLPDDPPMLVGLRPALAAVAACGRAAERIAAGPGPAPRTARDELEIDEARLERQLAKLVPGDRRIGDHEAKVLLAAYGVPVTRQAVATTPSAAVAVAKKVGFPVEIKLWGPDVPSERAGCRVERGVATAADVRRAFLAVSGAAGMPVDEASGLAVILRETPPEGREVSALIERVSTLGWTVIVSVPGAGGPLAAPAPLRVVEATELAAAVTSTRAGEVEPDRVALANLLRRASHLAVDYEDRIHRVELGRIVVGARGLRTMVVDAAIDVREL